jgi:hypothetical protein
MHTPPRRLLPPAIPLLLLALALVPLATPGAARAEETSGDGATPAVFPLSEVRPGLKGYGLTVKSGTTIERFEVEVVDVMRNFLAKQDVILVRCLGDEFADHRIAQGMSGSPIYFDDRVAGALAYAWSWAKHPLAGVTPIEAMLAEGSRPSEGRPAGAEPPTGIRRPEPVSAPPDGTRLVPIGTPLCLSGFSEATRAKYGPALAERGLLVEAGGGESGGAPGAWADREAPMAPGSVLMVDLLRGDLTAAALGTCTFVDGERVHGFGHPFNELGETLLPMSVGYVYTIVSSQGISFKIGTSLRAAGAIVQDRASGIVGILGREAPMIPFEVRFENPVTKRAEDFRFEVSPNRLFLQQIVLMALSEAFLRAEATFGLNTKRYSMTVKLKGMEEPWTYEDEISGFDGGLQRVLIGLVDRVMIHPTQRAEIESVKLLVQIHREDRRAVIEAVFPARDEVRPGEALDLRVRLRRREGGEATVEPLRIRIPADVPAGTYAFSVTGGDMVPADVAEPVAIADLPSLTSAFLKSTELVAVLPTGRVDLDMDGRLIRGLPLSSIPRLARSPEGRGLVFRPVTERVRREVPFVVEGARRVTVQIRR